MNHLDQLQNEKESFIKSLQLTLDARDIHFNDDETASAEQNTLSMGRLVLGVVYPRTIQQLEAIVVAANKHRVALYPVSQGKNIGYGEMTPTGANQLVVGLKYLNEIRDLDLVNGEVVVEPGVTQEQLCNYLKDANAKYWADMTGASPQASIVGNTLESGFGHTPIGDHRKHILQMEVMLTDGSLLKTSEMPAIGPDLAQIFIQSNFAIVTSIRIPLFPIPEVTETFTIAFNTDDDFFSGLEILTALRKDGTISSLAHTGNSTRALMTSSRFPKEFNPAQVLSEKECQTYLNKNSPIEFGAWSCIGGLYGYKNDVKNKKARMKQAFKGKASVKFFSDSKMIRLDSLLNSKLALKFKKLDFIRGSFASLKALHGIIRGQPSNHPSENILWRVNETKNLGLIWHAPVVPATKADCTLFLETCRQVYADYGFEMPITLTLINAKYMTSVLNISYDKSNAEETARAHAAYQSLTEATNDLGYFPYRCGIASKALDYYSDAQHSFLEKIKVALDPQNIIAPGRYGIGGGVNPKAN